MTVAATNGQPVLAARGLVKRYGKRVVVRDVSLRVGTGEVVGLLGPNGAGKTTAFYLITGLLPADAGQILLGNEDVTYLPMHARARMGIGYLPQEASVFRKLTVEENVLAILETRRDLHRKARRAELETSRVFRVAHGFDQPDPTRVYLYIFRNRAAYDRRRADIDACARAFATDPYTFEALDGFVGLEVKPAAIVRVYSGFELFPLHRHRNERLCGLGAKGVHPDSRFEVGILAPIDKHFSRTQGFLH